MAQPIELTIGMVLRLKKVCHDILFEKSTGGVVMERNLPFRLKYRLGKNMTYIDKYAASFMQNQLYFKATFGTENPETHEIEFDEEGKKKFEQAIRLLLGTKVTINVTTLEPEDIELLTHNTVATVEDIRIFTAFMMNEPEFFKDINSQVGIDLTKILEDVEKNL